MNGKENIISKILADADAKCKEILSAAEKQALEVAQAAKAFDEKEKAMLQKRLENIATERRRNDNSNTLLEARKHKLLKKQQLISACYEKARQQITKLPAKDKTAFLSKLINNYAENGETVVACKCDKDIVTQKFLDSFGKKLTLSKNYLDADGGIVLEGNGYDKDLTLDKILSYAREQTEAKVAVALFGE